MSWLPKRNVIVPFDFSDEAQQAVKTGMMLASKPEEVTVVYVAQDLAPLEMMELWHNINEGVRRERAMLALSEKLEEMGAAKVTREILFGEPGSAIADYAATKKADLIVIPSHGRRGLSRMLLGSVSEKVVRLAHCPVLVLRW
jgi:nucleotide-binding universal stress UspA family protein